MSAICLIDTSIFVEILNVPKKAKQHSEIIELLRVKIEAKESLFLPMATIIETGNHIAQNGDGNLRRDCADRFVNQVWQALNGESPFQPISFLTPQELQKWLAEFPNLAMQGVRVGDLSIIHDFNRICCQNPRRRVYIWALDRHLQSYDSKPSN
jgi:hypothetical protein